MICNTNFVKALPVDTFDVSYLPLNFIAESGASFLNRFSTKKGKTMTQKHRRGVSDTAQWHRAFVASLRS